MTTRRRDLQRALGAFLSLHVAQVGDGGVVRRKGRFGTGQHLRAFDVVDQRQQRSRRQHIDIAGPGGLSALFGGAHDPAPGGVGADGGGQDACDPGDRAIQRELAQNGVGIERIVGQYIHRHQHGNRDRQIEMRALFQHIGGRKIDGDPPRRQSEPHRGQGRAHPFAGFGNRLVRQADDIERHHA